MILEHDGGRIAINPDRFDKLITALRTAVDTDGALHKEATSYNNIFDAFRLALKLIYTWRCMFAICFINVLIFYSFAACFKILYLL